MKNLTQSALGCLLICALSATSPHAFAQGAGKALPRFGDGADLGYAQEQSMGQGIMAQLLRSPRLEVDPFLNDQVARVWQRLREAALSRGLLPPDQDRQFTWELSLFREPELNAFALPGGYMGLHLGLIAGVETEAEMASVMAHELGHVTQRHIARMLAKSDRELPLVVGSVILGILVAGQSNQAAQALIAGGQAAGMASQLGFSRDMEREADRMGFAIHSAAGYEPIAFVHMFRQLSLANRLQDTQSFPYLRSHPLTTEREADMMTRVQQQGPSTEPVQSLQFAMIRARARVLLASASSVELDRLMEQTESIKSPDTAAGRVAVSYTKALAWLKKGQTKAALSAWTELDARVPLPDQARAWVRALKAEIHLAQGEALAAIEALGKGPHSRAERLLMAQARLATGQATERRAAIEDLELLLMVNSLDSVAWEWVAQAWQAEGFVLRALRAQAEVQHTRYDDRGALDRLRAAQDMADRMRAKGEFKPSDWQDLEIIQSRWRRIQERHQALLKSRLG